MYGKEKYMKLVVKGKVINCVITAILTAALLVSLIPATALRADAEDGTASGKQTVKLAILSDIHYVSAANRGGNATEDFKKAELAENRMMSEIDLILSQALKDAAGTQPDAMLVCGDLCSNGEYSGEFELASKLSKAKKDYDTDIYVVNGNHDINMSYSADFTGEKVTSARRTQAADFKGIYEKLGYGSNARFFNADPQAGSEVKNYGGLSYATEIQDGVTLIALDTAQYSGDENAEYNNGQMTAGYVSDKLLAWAKSEAQAAKKKGNLVLAMCHHSLVPHQGVKNKASDMFFSEYLIPDWEKVAGTLADAGVSVVLTGHSHANDISQYTTKAGNTIYDIQTAALCAYPCAWRTLEITIDKSGTQPSYSFDVDSHFMDHADGLNLTYNGKTYNNLQEYSFVKTGIPEEALPNMAEFLIREQLFQIKSHEDGFQGFLKDEIGVPEGKTAGQYGTEEIAKLIDTAEPVEEKIELFGADITLKFSLNKTDSEPNKKIFDVELSYKYAEDFPEVTIAKDKIPEEIKLKLKEMEEKQDEDNKYVEIEEVEKDGVQCWKIHMYSIFPAALKVQLLELAGISPDHTKTEKGQFVLDLSGMAAGIDDAIDKADRYIRNDKNDCAGWENNYQRTPIEKEVSKALTEKVVPLFTTPITEGDDKTAPLFIARDALQAFARGDEESSVPSLSDYEGMSSSDLNTARKNWNKLIKSEAFEDNIRKTIMDTVYAVTEGEDEDDPYPILYDILNTDMAPESGKAIYVEAGDESENPTLNALGEGLGEIKTPALLIRFANLLGNIGTNPLAGVPLTDLTDMFSQLQESLTTDVNIKNDSKWAFHTVTLDPAGGTASILTTVTVEGNKAAALPTPTRKGYNFLGWFTEKKAGTKITKSTDLSKVQTIYAHWQDRKTQMGKDGTPYGKGAAIEALEKAIAKLKSEKDPKGTKVAPLLLKSTKQTKNSIKLAWKKPAGTKKHVLYGNICGTKNNMKKLKTLTKTSFNVKKAVKKLKKGKYYKFMVVAVDKNNNVVSSSKIIHAATKGGKVGNHKKVVVKKSILAKAKKLKKGKTLSLKPTLKLQSKKLKFKKHVAIRYESSNTNIATVSGKGKIKAKKAGSCKVYVYAQNGMVKKVSVKVK